MKRVAVVIPYYHSNLSELELISYSQCIKKLSKHPIILLVPDNMLQSEYPTDKCIEFKKVPSSWLRSVDTYNKMMLNREFYELFCSFEYILIYQLDAFVFEDRLIEFCNYDYDYIGAPWLRGVTVGKADTQKKIYVGNGGLSLRKVDAFLRILRANLEEKISIAEDVFWASQSSDTFRIAPINIALQFSIEVNVRVGFKMNKNRLPFGCHAWEKYDFRFWEKYILEEDYSITTIVNGNLDELMKQERNKARRETILNRQLFYFLEEQRRKALLEVNKEIVWAYCDSFFGWKNKEIYIWGAGIRGKKFGEILNHISVSNFQYIDIDKSRCKEKLNGAEVVGKDIFERITENVCIIISVKGKEEEIMQILSSYGYKKNKEVFFYQEWLEGLGDIKLKEV